MRAKVAAKYGGHAFEDRYMKLDPTQLTILFFQALEEDKKEREGHVDLIKAVKELLFQKLDAMSELHQVFTNPKMYKAKMDMAEIKEHSKEINEDNFLETWDELMAVIPEEYVVDETSTSVENYLSVEDEKDEWAELISGWKSTSRKYKEE